MSTFYHTYQFIPVTGEINGNQIRQGYDEIKQGISVQNPMVRHDLWVQESLSGRMICSIYLNSPTVVGNRHTADSKSGKKRIEQYCWKGRPALPANSLKGVISSMAEALSQSALRVLGADEEKHMRVQDDGSRFRDRSHEPREPDGKRKTPVPNSVHTYFDHIDHDMKPWQTTRGKLTVAELLFGAVEVNEKGEQASQNLRGRLRFSDARALGDVAQLPEITLKLLGEPKTPCPSMYYHVKGHRGKYLAKEKMFDYRESQSIIPNGRKYYLHHPQSQRINRPWETHGNPGQEQNKFLCSPLKSEQTFYFHIDFENLSAAELTLLYTAIQPDEHSQQRLGLGKPLGLGSVTILTEGVFFIDRKSRYGLDALNTSRYNSAWTDSDKAWQALYPEEARMDAETSLPKALIDTQLIDMDTLAIARTLCNPEYVRNLPIRTPILDDQDNTPEQESFKWFNENDQKGNQAMPQITPYQNLLPIYSDMIAAGNSRRFAPVEISVLDEENDPIEEVLEILQEHVKNSEYENLAAITQSRELAEFLRDKIPEAQRQQIFDWLIPYWVENGVTMKNSVERIYDKICPNWRKIRAALYEE